MKFNLTTFQGRLIFARKYRELSQSALSKQVGTSQTLVGRWERGEVSPRGSSVGRIAAALKVSRAWLMIGQCPMEDTPSKTMGGSLA